MNENEKQTVYISNGLGIKISRNSKKKLNEGNENKPYAYMRITTLFAQNSPTS